MISNSISRVGCKLAFVLILVAFLSERQPFDRADSLIVGGKDVIPGEYPFVALIEKFTARADGKHEFICSGSIIDKRHILTAANCLYFRGKLYKAHNLHVSLGCHSINKCTAHRLKVNKVTPHNNHKEHVNDLAVLELAEDIAFNNYVGEGGIRKIIKSPEAKDDEKPTDVIVVGWGRGEDGNNAETLKYALLRTLPLEDCKKRFRAITENEMCAKGNDAGECQGDSGGPLFKMDEGGTFIQVGVVSMGPFGCGNVSIYSRVARNRGWILAATGRE